MAYHLSLDETADQNDLQLEVAGIPFVSDQRNLFALTSVVVDVQEYWGREGIVAYSTGFAGGC